MTPGNGRTTTEHRNRLPDPGAGFVWDPPVLRPRTAAVEAAFTTRRAGRSVRPYDTLNLGASVGDDPEDVAANRAIALGAIGRRGSWFALRQVHGARVVRATSEEPGRPPGHTGPIEADGAWTDDPDVSLGVAAADCVPVLLVGEARVAVVHVGWRGAVAGAVEAAVGAVGPCAVFAGPAIGPCCFEVGPEVRDAFATRFDGGVVTDARHVDLWAAVERAAVSAGADEVHDARVCTSCHPDLFFSHRRDGGRTGRQGLVAALARAAE